MLEKIAMIIPTRGRPDKALEAVSAINANSIHCCDVILGVDDDQVELYTGAVMDTISDPMTYCQLRLNPRLRMNGTLNKIAAEVALHYKYVGFMGDDHRVRTPGWDVTMMSVMEEVGNVAIAYGDDGHQGPNIPTAVVMTSNIIRKLGYMAPPELIHMYLDNTWKTWGEGLDVLRYVPHVKIEHMHPHAGKAESDAQYEEVNAPDFMHADLARYNEYCSTRLQDDLNKLRSLI